MKTKLDLAHDYIIRFSGVSVEDAWQYADAMYLEMQKRNQVEAKEKAETPLFEKLEDGV